VLKGDVPVAEVRLNVRQNRATASMDYLGLWSQVAFEEGAEYVAFCKGASRDPAVLLRDDDGCERLVPASEVLEDVQAAVGAEEHDAGVTKVTKEAWTDRSRRGPVYARWLWDRLAPEALRAPSGFEPIARLIEDPETAQPAREAYVQAAYQALMESSAPVARQRARLVRALFSVLQLPAAQGMASNVEGVLLRNLLHLDHEPGTPPASEVFRDRPKDRAAAQSTLRSRPPSAARDRLLHWIEAN
jgi:hypothetical protein